MKTNCQKFIQWAVLASLMASVTGCGRKTENQDANLSLISAVGGGGPMGRMVATLLRERACAGGIPHAGSSVAYNNVTRSIIPESRNRAINIEK